MFTQIPDFDQMVRERKVDLSEPVSLYMTIAESLAKYPGHNFKARASFIRDQCNGFDGKKLFQKYRKSWDIPIFNEGILEVSDFKRGFLYRFREYSTSWNDSLNAKRWFLTAEEARAVRRYEFRHCDNGFEECATIIEGSYREILDQLLLDGDFSVLQSPAYSATYLKNFINSYDAEKGDFSIEEIVDDYIENNPNYKG